jgi:flagellar motor switch protein FliM
MTSTVLTHEELAALREETRRDAGTQDLDLTGVERAQRQNMTQLDRALTRLAASTQLELSRVLRIACEATPTPPEIVASTALRHLLDRNPVTVPLMIDGEHAGWLGVPGELCFCLVERSFGGRMPTAEEEGEEWQPGRTRLTTLEKRTVWPLLEALVAGLAGSLTEEDTPVTVGTAPDGPEPELPEVSEALAGGVEVDVAGTHYRLELVLVASYRSKKTSAAGDGSVGMSLRAQVKRARVEVTSELGSIDVSVGELLSLKPGDVLRLDRSQSDPLLVFVEAVPKFLARPLHRKGCFALQIETEIQ